MDLKDAAEKARTANRNQRKEDLQKEEGNNGNDTPGCLLFFILLITGIVLGARHVNAEPELYKARWFFYFAFSAGSFIGSIIICSIVGAIFPFLKVSSSTSEEESKRSPEDELKKEQLLKALGAGKVKSKDGEWLFALALDAPVTVNEEFFTKGISSYNDKFSEVECSGLGEMIWAVEFDGCHCHLTFMPAPMPQSFNTDSFPHCMFPKEERERFLNHKAFVNFTFSSKKKNPKVRYLQAFALISCFKDSLSGIQNSTIHGLSSPQVLNVVKENKLGPLQPACHSVIHELKKPDGFAWYVTRGHALFGIPDFATLAPSGNAGQMAVMLNGILNMVLETKLETSIGSVIEVSEQLKLKIGKLYEYEDYIKICEHKVVVLADANQEIPQSSSGNGETINHDEGTELLEAQNKKMIDWIAHPAEYCKPPAEIKILRHLKTKWPAFDDEIDVFFHSFDMGDGEEKLAISGPIEWAFRGTQLKEFSEEEQKWIFAGWFMMWLVENNHKPGCPPEASHDEAAIKLVEVMSYDNAEVKSKINITDGVLVYAFKAQKDDKDIFLLFELSNTNGGFLEIDAEPWSVNDLDPIYYALGKIYFEEDLNPTAAKSDQ